MPDRPRKLVPILAAVALLALGVAALLVFRPRPEPPPDPNHHLADLGEEPDWSALDRYHGVLTRAEFEKALRDVYLLKGVSPHCRITDEAVTIEARALPAGQQVRFAAAGEQRGPPRYWRPASELPPAPGGQPLAGLRIAIDPGHIGGDYAKLEERWYQFGDARPVQEGDMTLRTARLLAPRLEALGAKVTLVRDKTEPVTPSKPEDFLSYARARNPDWPREDLQRHAERLFYRTADIRARAALVNDQIQPDLVLCLHFNAEGWNDPRNPSFSSANHFHIILHGAYTATEIAHDDERFEMMHKIFQRVHAEELALASEAARAFMSETGLPAYIYSVGKPAIPLGPALWARNLLANRLYRCPVLFYEPYVMNNEEVHERVQAGDYEGEREVAGQLRKSLYREYAAAVVAGLLNYYAKNRKAGP